MLGFLLNLLRISQKAYEYLISSIYRIVVTAQVKSFETSPNINGKTILNSNTKLGRNTNFNGLVVYGSGPITIGDNFHSGPNCKIHTSNHNYKGDKIPYDDKYIHKPVIIEDNVWIGQGVTILPGVTIREGAIVQAESVVVHNVEKCAIVGGSPAKKFSKRDECKYERLKSNRNFH